MPLKNKKKKGSRNEHKTIRYFSADHFYCIKSGGSLGVFDIVCFGVDRALLVQIKSNRWPDHTEVAAIQEFPTLPYTRKLIVRWDDYARKPQVREVP